MGEAENGRRALDGVRVVVQGVGKVGGGLARRLALEGARVWVSDLECGARQVLASETGAATLRPAEALGHPCDLLAPCALGGVLTRRSAPGLRCRWVVGAANNQLSDDGVADLLRARGIGYVPDFIANAGGLISVSEELHGWDADRTGAAADGIEAVVGELIASAREEGGTILAAAHRRAADRLAADPAGLGRVAA